MDKFTVDLEKVLDDFEYNEGREETVLPSVVRNHSYSHNSPRSVRPPAANYRRPAFEPISLADADFAAAPSSVCDKIIPISRPKTLLDSSQLNRNLNECFKQNPTTLEYLDVVNNQNNSREVSEIHETIDIVTTESSSANDDTPDLLDSNFLKQTQNGGKLDPVVPTSQLPDITSVRSIPPEMEIKKTVEVFDLIKPHHFSTQDNKNSNELPPIVDVCSVIKESLPEVKLAPVTFDSIDVSQSDLDNYLDDLEVNDNVAGEIGYSYETGSLETSQANELNNSISIQSSVINEEHEISTDSTENVLISENNNPVTVGPVVSEKVTDSSQPMTETLVASNVITESLNDSVTQVSITSNVDVESLVDNSEPQTTLLIPSDTCESSNLNSVNNNVPTEDIVDREDSPIAVAVDDQVPEDFETSLVETIGGLVGVKREDNQSKASDERSFDDNTMNGNLEELMNGENSECESPSESSLPSTVTLESEINTSDEVLPCGQPWTPDEAEPNTLGHVATSEGLQTDQVAQQPVDTISHNLENLQQEVSPMDGEDQMLNRPLRPSSLALPPHALTDSEESPTPSNSSTGASVSAVMSPEERTLGKMAPYWVPDSETDQCMHCNARFTVIKRRHHCRACGLVLCSKCCNLKAPLEYMENAEARVCQPCYNIIFRGLDEGRYNRGRQPNPNNPMEYCSTVPPPLQQPPGAAQMPPPAVFVPTSVLKRQGSKNKSETPKQVMFSDGIRPGGDLTELDGTSEAAPRLLPRRSFSRKMAPSNTSGESSSSGSRNRRPMDSSTQSWIPAGGGLPPTCNRVHGAVAFCDPPAIPNPACYAINPNLTVRVGRTHLNCCVAREVWSAASEGLCLVGQDEIAIVVECLPEETQPPVDIFHLVNFLWKQGTIGNTSSEMSFTQWPSGMLFGSNDHAGFLYIRPSLQCLTNLILPVQPYLVAILVHRWEVPWARLFPLRLMLRLGAEYRYYPCSLVSVRNRQPLYTDIGHTIMKILVDFRKFSYSLATVRGLLIHVEDRQTTILFPRNRYDQVTRALNNSNESVLAFGANLSPVADSHLVCIQGTKDDDTAYHTEAINIHNKPRRVTGASFVVFNGALKAATGLSGKSSIVEDGLMVHLPAERMSALRAALRSMQDFSISCGPNDEETVLLHWTADDTNFNVGVKSFIDGQPLDGVPSIRVHNGTDFPNQSRIIRWTEVFIIQCEDSGKAGGEPLDISRVSESLSRATCSALAPVLDSLANADLTSVGVRATIHQDNVGYEAGSREKRLPTSCMRQLDDELVPVLHQAALAAPESPAILELIFHIMNL